VGLVIVGLVIVGFGIVGGRIVGGGFVEGGFVEGGTVGGSWAVKVVVSKAETGQFFTCPIVCIIEFIVVSFASFEEVPPASFGEGAIVLLMIESDDSVELFVILFDFNSSAFFSIAKAYAIASSAD